MQTRRDSLHLVHRALGIGCALLVTGSGALAQTATGFGQPGAAPRAAGLETGVYASVVYSDNVTLDAAGAEQSGFITEISPYLRASIYGPRLNGEVDYTLRSFVRTAGDESWFKHNLHARGTVALAGDWLWLSGAASIADVSALPFGKLSFDPGLYGENSTQRRTFSLSPYVIGHFGTFADYRAQYDVATSNLAGTTSALARLEQKFSANVTSGAQFNRWGWSWSAERQRREYASDLVLDRNSSAAKVFYLVDPELRVGAAIHYDAIDGLVNEDGDRRGFGPGASVDWNPSRRTTLRAEIAKQYYGNTGKISFAHRRELFTFGLNYTRNVLTSSDASALLFDANALYAAGGFNAELNPLYQALVVDSLLRGYGIPQGAGILSDGVVQNRTLTASGAYQSLRNRVVVNVYRSLRDSQVDTELSALGGGIRAVTAPLNLTLVGELEQTGANVTWEHKLDAATTLSVIARQSRVKSPTLDTASRLWAVEVGARRKLAQNMTAGVGIRHSTQSTSGAENTAYDENAIFGSVDYRF